MKRFFTYAISLTWLICCAAFGDETPAPKRQPLVVHWFHFITHGSHRR